MLEQQAVDGNFSNKIFSTLVGFVNKQICRIWGSLNHQVIEERLLHPEKGTVIGPYFFENDDGTTVTVNLEHYGHMKNGCFYPLLKNATWSICSFNRTTPHVIQLKRIWLYCKRHFLAV